MVKFKTRESVNSKEFAKKLITNHYILRDEECLKTALVYSSDWNNPNLYRVSNYHFKINYLVHQMHLEMKKQGIVVPVSKIREDSLKKEVVIYQKMILDKRTGKLVDYFFILDTKLYKVMVFKRETDFSNEQKRVYRAIKYLHDELFMDFDEIFKHLMRNGFDISYQMITHIVSEL
jgi:galactokinase